MNYLILQTFGMTKAVVAKTNNILSMMVNMFSAIHILACIWVGIAKISECSWIEQGSDSENPVCGNGIPVDEENNTTVYVTAIYWVITTLTTVGYGDYKGYTPNEYTFQMVVEFLGIGVFSWLMGAINGMV